MKIVIGNKEQKSGYFEIGYTFTLDVPQAQQVAKGKLSSATSVSAEPVVVDNATIDISGVASYIDGTSIEDIQADLIKRINEGFQGNLSSNS